MTFIDVFQFVFNLFSDQDLIAKIVLSIFLILYTLFAIVLARQISLMTNLVNQTDFSPFLKLLSLVHIVASIAVLVFVLLIV